MQTNMSIKQRLTMGFGAVLAVTALAIMITGRQVESTRTIAENITDKLNPQVAAANDLAMSAEMRTASLRGYVTTGERRYFDKYKNAVVETQTALDALKRLPAGPVDRQLIGDIDRHIVQMRQEELQIIGVLDRKQPKTAFRRHQSDLRPITDDAVVHANELASLGHQRISDAAREFHRASNRLNRVIRLSFVAALLLAIGFIVATVRSVSHPAKTIALAADAVADGDYGKALALREDADVRNPFSTLAEPRDELRKIAVAIGNMAYALNRREKRLKAHASLGEKCTSTLDIDCLLDSALEDLARHTGSLLAIVYLSDGGQLRTHGAYGLSREDAERAGGGPGGMVEHVAKSGESLVLTDIPHDTAFVISPGLGKAIPKSIACMPMMVESRVLGVLVTASLTVYDGDMIALMETSADQIGIALSNAVSHHNVQRLAEELRTANEHLDAQNEELQAQNEELQAQNEEIQAQNEEIQAQNEEIQAQNEELATQRAELQESYTQQLSIAETLQKSFLPHLQSCIGDYEIAHQYVPAQSEALIGGDFYDVIELGDGVIGIVIGDVSGKGVGATVHTAMAKYMLRGIVSEESDPAAVMLRLNNAITQTVQSEVFITMFYGVLYTQEKRLVYANAGHELPILLKCETGQCISLDATGQPMGIFPDANYERREMHLSDGDALVLYTDGITEARRDKSFFGTSALESSVMEVRHMPASEMVECVLDQVREFSGNAFRDDAALVVIKSHAAESSCIDTQG